MNDAMRGTSPKSLAELQRLWFTLRKRAWASLVVVPSHAGGSSLVLARTLADVGSAHLEKPVKLLSAEKLEAKEAARIASDMVAHATNGQLVIVAMDSVFDNPAGIAIGLAADAALLCVELGKSDLASAEKTLELLGKERFVGSITVRA